MSDENRNTPILIKNLCLRNFLGFGDTGGRDKGVNVELRSFNVIIGPNGSGKSNFIEAIDLIRSTPSTSESSNLLAAIRDGGGEAEVIPKIGFGGDAQCPGGDAQQMSWGFLDGGCRGVQDFRGKNPFGQVVDAFEVPPRGRCHFPYSKQPFKTHLGVFPSPPR